MKRHECQTVKTCTKCKAEKPLSEFYFHNTRKHYVSRCKVCTMEDTRANVLKQPDVVAARQARYRQRNAERLKEQKAQWYQANRDAEREKRKEYHKQHADVAIARARKWYAENKERAAKRGKDYVKQNADAVRAYQAMVQRVRKTKVRQATPPWFDKAKALALYVQAAELSKESGIQHHVDHIVPIQGANVNGLHWHGNMQVLSASENIRKGNKLIEDIV